MFFEHVLTSIGGGTNWDTHPLFQVYHVTARTDELVIYVTQTDPVVRTIPGVSFPVPGVTASGDSRHCHQNDGHSHTALQYLRKHG